MDRDFHLIERTRNGDLRAFEALIDRHRDVVFRVATRIVGREEAEDVSQDAFLRAFHGLSTFRGEAPFRSWLLQITHNAALSALARRRPDPVDPQEHLDHDPASTVREPAEMLESRERQERLQTKLRMIAPVYRALVVLRDVEGLSYDEIAQVTEMPLGSVKGRLHRARAELIELLRNNTYDWELPE